MKIRDIAPFGLRMKPELKEWYKNFSKENNRSMNYSIIEALEFFKQNKQREVKNANI